MTIEEITRALKQGGRVTAKYRDQWGFIIHGVILAVDGGDVLIDTLKNRVSVDQILSIKHI